MPHCEEKLFTIGQVSKRCNISKKTLRYYEELGLIEPDYVCQANGYRYYNENTMLLIPIIKYYKQMGFKLQEMLGVTEKGSRFYHENKFVYKLDDLEEERVQINNRYTAVEDWLNLLREGSMVLENKIDTINIKYLERKNYYFQEQSFNECYQDSIINIAWVNHLEKKDCSITGPVCLEFNSVEERMNRKATTVSIMQEPVGRLDSGILQKEFGGDMFLCAYHIGNPEKIMDTYNRLKDWAISHAYDYGPNVYERYVIDYWTTKDPDEFVSEVIFPIKKRVNMSD